VAVEPVRAARWQVLGAVCVTRHPVLCRPMNEVEQRYSEHLQEIEVENSLLCDFELKMMEDEARKVLGESEEDIDDTSELRSALESQDLWNQEESTLRQSFNLDSGAPEYSFGSSLERQVVLVQQKGGHWMLPTAAWREGETLRQTCERVVETEVDPSLEVEIIGNAPIGFYKYKYPKSAREQTGFVGAKVFLYRGAVSSSARQCLSRLAAPSPPHTRWLVRQQLAECLAPRYARALADCLVDDS